MVPKGYLGPSVAQSVEALRYKPEACPDDVIAIFH